MRSHAEYTYSHQRGNQRVGVGRQTPSFFGLVAAPSANELPPTPALPRGVVAVREPVREAPQQGKVIVGAVLVGALIVVAIAVGLLR